MAFGQAAGPPASGREIEQITELLDRCGFGSLKEARHPYGLNQRQAAGRFTRDEAAALIDRLETELAAATPGSPSDPPAERAETAGTRADAPPDRAGAGASGTRAQRQRREDQRLHAAGLADEVLVAELELRGWTCLPPR